MTYFEIATHPNLPCLCNLGRKKGAFGDRRLRAAVPNDEHIRRHSFLRSHWQITEHSS